jgi:hypothetical protein
MGKQLVNLITGEGKTILVFVLQGGIMKEEEYVLIVCRVAQVLIVCRVAYVLIVSRATYVLIVSRVA